MEDKKSYKRADDFVVRIRGLPWSAKEPEVREFFSDCSDIRSVHFTFTKELRPTGEAFVELGSKEDVEIALSKHKASMKNRYIEVFTAKRSEMEFVLKRSAPIVPLIASGNTNDNVVRLRGLPFGCTSHDIEEFFAGLPIAEEGIVRPIDRTGRVTGEAYVKFLDQDAAEQALAKHMKEIGNRYIEIFRSTEGEMYVAKYPDGGGPNDELYFGKAAHSSRKRLRGGNSGGIPSLLDTIDYQDQKSSSKQSKLMKSFIGSATGHMIHMRGLPFSATATDIVEFFQPTKVLNIMVMFDETSGRPIGEADVEFLHHEDAVQAMQKDKQHMGERYIELFMDSLPSPAPFLEMSADDYAFGNGFQAAGGPMQMHGSFDYVPGYEIPVEPIPFQARRPFGLSAYPPSYY